MKFQPRLFRSYLLHAQLNKRDAKPTIQAGQSTGAENKQNEVYKTVEEQEDSIMTLEEKNLTGVKKYVGKAKQIDEKTVKGKEQLEGGSSTGESENESWEELFAEAIRLHQSGVAGNKKAVKEACELLEKVRGLVPQNNLVEAYYGSATALQGRDAIDPMDRFKKAVKGLKILDGVVSKEPENIEIRILRAKVCFPLPEKFFHRTATAVEDFSYLASRYKNDPSVFSPEFYWQVLYDLGVSYKRLGRKQEAESTWLTLLSISEDNKYKELLRQEGMPVPDLPKADHPVPEAKLPDSQKGDLINAGIKLYELARSGDKESIKKAFSFFKKATEAAPDDHLLKAYHADCMSLTARDSLDPGEMFSSPIKAMKIFDSAVNGSPDNIKIRFMRAYHGFRLPEAFFRRTASAIGDFEYLIQRYESDNSVFPIESYWQLLYDLGLAYHRLELNEEASSTWEKLLSLDPDPKYKAMVEGQRSEELLRSPVEQLSLDDREAYYNEGFRLHDLGVAGNKTATKMALDLWQKAYEADPRDTVARAYYGSSMALAGRDSTTANTIFGSAIKGLVHLNRAISRDRNNTRIRVLRAFLAYSLPEVFFHQTNRAIKDFKYLKMAYEQDNSVLSDELYHKILYNLGEAYHRTNDSKRAKKVWSKLMEVSSDPKYQSLISERMETGDES